MKEPILPSARRCFQCVARLLLVAIALGICATKIAAEEQATPPTASADTAESADKSVLYRRIFVPADRVEVWPRDEEKYLPIEASEFIAWIEAAARKREPAVISDAKYSARFDGERLVEGRGQWTIDLRENGPVFLPLRNVSIRLRRAYWRGAPQQPARLGSWGESGGLADQVGLEVPQSGVLEFEWQVRAKSIQNGIEIRWQLPAATTSKILLDLPEGKTPRIDGGVVLASDVLPSEDADDSNALRRWELVLGSSRPASLQITDNRPVAAESANAPSLHDDVIYKVTQRGLEMEATWNLGDSTGQFRELNMPLPEGVQLESVVVGKQTVPYRFADEERAREKHITIDLSKVADARPLQIKVRAWHPLVLDRAWQLPKLRPDAAFWTSGHVQLAIDPQLELRSLSPIDCLESSANHVGDAGSDFETWRFSAYSPMAEVDVDIARREPDVSVRLGSSLAFADPDVSGRLITQWNVADGKLHRLSGELARGWIVEAVETTPAEALGEWFVDRRDGRRSVEIQLARPAESAGDLSVVITGRLQRSGIGEPISAETMRMVTWQSARVDQHFLAFQTAEPYAVEAVGNLKAIASDTLDDVVELLDSVTAGDSIFDLADADSGAGLMLTLERGQFEGDVRLEAIYSRQQLEQTHYLTVRPTKNRIDHVLVYSTVPLGENTRWTDNQSRTPLSAERLPVTETQAAQLPTAGELWLVRLPPQNSRIVEIAANVTTSEAGRQQIPLLAMPEATKQRGLVLLRGAFHEMPSIEPGGMRAVPLPVATNALAVSHDQPPARAAFRFNPADCMERSRAPSLWIGAAGRPPTGSLIARRVELESFVSSEGNGTHQATYHLECEGASSIDVRLSRDATLKSVLMDGEQLERPVLQSPGELLPIRFPSRTGAAILTLTIDTRQSPLTAGDTLTPPIIEGSTPILDGEWTIWLPDEFSMVAPDGFATEKSDWRKRLFGPLGRPGGAQPFHPLHLADWQMIANSVVPSQQAFGISAGSIHGWQAYQSTFIAGGPVPVVVARPPALATWSLSIFLLCLVIGGWIFQRAAMLFVALLAAAAATSLALPTVFAPLATGMFLGLLFSLFVTWPRRQTPEMETPLSWSRFSTAGLIGLAVVVGSPYIARAETAEEQRASGDGDDQATIHRVLIPTGADGSPSGTKYFVSERFLRELLRTDAEHAENQWLLTDATYTGQLRERGESPGIVAGDWMITYEIEVLARDTTIMLPLVRDEAEWPTSAMLDGVPTPIVWQPDGRGCAISISEPGRYSLVITCVPRTSGTESENRVALTVPPCSGAILRLRHPRAMSGIAVPGAEVSQLSQTNAEVPEWELDGSPRLEVRWPEAGMAVARPENLRVTRLGWLHISTEETQLDTKYILEGSARRPKALVIAFDRGWELIQDENSPVEVREQERPDDRSDVRIPLPPSDGNRQEIVLRWRLTNGKPLGQLRLPRIELISIPVTQRWLGVSAAASLDCTILEGSASQATASEFLAMWGDEAAEAPQIVLGNIRAGDTWSMSVAPRQTPSQIDEVVHIGAGREAFRVLYQADVAPGSDHKFQFPLSVPANLAIEAIELTHGDQNIPLRWARVAGDRVNVFFSQEISSEYRLVLRGNTPLDAGDAHMLPLVSAATEPVPILVQLYREEDVLVDVQGTVPSKESTDVLTDMPATPWSARPIGTYRLNQTSADSVRLSIKANDVEISGDTITTLRRESDAWWADFNCNLVVQQGVLDTFQLRVPATWVGPFEADADVPTTIEITSLDDENAMLSVRLARPIATGDKVDFQIRGPLAIGAASSVAVPDIIPEHVVAGSRYVAVPESVGAQQLAWSDIGVKLANPPKELFPDAPTARMRTFEIVAAPFQVALQPPDQAIPSSRVRLADTIVSEDSTGGQLIVTRFVMESNNLAECILRLPDDQELVTVRLDGRPAQIRKLDAASWRLPPGPQQLPCMLEIVSRSSDADLSARNQLRRPSLLASGNATPVEISLWSFGYPAKPPRFERRDAAEVAATDQTVLRFERLLSIAEAATPIAADSPFPDGYNWFVPWAERLTALRQQAMDTRAPVNHSTPSQVAAPLDDQLATASGRLDDWIAQCQEILGKGEFDPLTGQLATTRLFSNPPGLDWKHWVMEGGGDRLVVGPAPVFFAGKLQLAGQIATIAGLAVIILLLLKRPAIWDVLYRWPHAVGFLAGIAVWAWLWPSWCGLLIAAASVALAFWTRWPGRTIRLEGSTVVRAARTT
jgi:hypothetical protein